MLKVGITGGIGSGKTTVARVFEVQGIPVYYADDAAKRLMNEDEALKQKIKEQFGESIYINGNLNRKELAHIVFNAPEKLSLLNAIIHPATIKDAARWMQQQTTTYSIKEAALIFESGAQDGVSREEVIARMNKQMDEEIKMKLCNFVITNDEQELLIPQVLALHQTILSLTQNK